MSHEPWRYISLLKLENETTRMRLKNRLHILLYIASASYTHFSDDYLLIWMTIYNFICLYNRLHHPKDHSVNLEERLVNFRYIVVYIL